jgi:ribosomal protein S5
MSKIISVKRKELKGLHLTHTNQGDILKDLADIKDLLEEQTGMNITGANVVRACIKAWYDLNNNG